MDRGAALRRAGTLRRAALAAASKTRSGRSITGFDRATRALVCDRDAVCQGCGDTPSQAKAKGLRLEVHHRWAAGRGGPDTADNGVLICGLGNYAGCHRKVDQDRAWALTRGLVLRTGTNPGAVPVVDSTGHRWHLFRDGTRRAA